MFGLSKSKKQKLEDKHKKLLAESFRLSRVDRKKSDELLAQAADLQKEIDRLTESDQ